MSRKVLVKQGSFDADVEGQINDNFAELYNQNAGGTVPSGDFIVGDSGNVGRGVAMSGDATLSNLGAVTVASIGGKKIARGVHTQVAASDTVVTGLATVVAVVVSFQSAPTVKQLYAAGSVGDQAGTPAAGSILINTYKPTAVDNCTPTAATDFSENLKIAWVAIGT